MKEISNKHFLENKESSMVNRTYVNDIGSKDVSAESNDFEIQPILYSTQQNQKEVEEECKTATQTINEQFLPEWIKPNMVHSKSSVTRTGFLGCGEFGIVQRGVFHHGTAV